MKTKPALFPIPYSLYLKYIPITALGLTLLTTSACAPNASPAGRRNSSDFDADLAFTQLEKQLGFGPRNPGSPGHRKAKEYLVAELAKYADSVEEQDFLFKDDGVEIPMTNILAVIRSQDGRGDGEKVMLGAHWDTRPFADQDPDPANRNIPIMGANDGASGVAVLLEVARVLSTKKPPREIIIALFDGEDYGINLDKFFIGSRYLAQDMGEYRPDYGILVDMVGDKNLNIFKEVSSQLAAPEIVEKVWSAAAKLGYDEFHPEVKHRILDDHISFLNVGIKFIDIIDFDYRYWHTLQDTIDKVDAKSLKIVGDVLLEVIYSP